MMMCRYCKDNFDQWEKLVTHRRDEHSREFEALKRRSALLLRKQEEALTLNGKSSGTDSVKSGNDIPVKSIVVTRISRKMKASSPSFFPSPSSSIPRRNHQSSSKAVDAKDLENQEISLCVPRSSSNASSSSLVRSSTPPFSFPTPTSSPRVNGTSTTPNRHSRIDCNGKTFISSNTPSSPPFPTPPATPSRPSPYITTCPFLSNEEFVLIWSPPVDIRTAVQYHQLDDEDEIELCTEPTSGSCFSVTKHSRFENRLRGRLPPPPSYKNGGTNNNAGTSRSYLSGNGNQQAQSSNSNRVVFENLEHELTMICSHNGTNNGTTPNNSEPSSREHKTSKATREVNSRVTRRRSHVEMLRSTGQRLKRLQSQLQLRQTRSRFASRVASSSAKPVPAISRNAASRRLQHATNHSISTRSTKNTRNAGQTNGRRSSTAVNTSTNIPRINRLTTRASTRRPK